MKQYIPMVQVTLRADHLTAIYGYIQAYTTTYLHQLQENAAKDLTEASFKGALNKALAYIQTKNQLEMLILDFISVSLGREASRTGAPIDIMLTEPEYNFIKQIVEVGKMDRTYLKNARFTEDQIEQVMAIIGETIDLISKGKVLSQEELAKIDLENQMTRMNQPIFGGRTKVGQA